MGINVNDWHWLLSSKKNHWFNKCNKKMNEDLKNIVLKDSSWKNIIHPIILKEVCAVVKIQEDVTVTEEIFIHKSLYEYDKWYEMKASAVNAIIRLKEKIKKFKHHGVIRVERDDLDPEIFRLKLICDNCHN